MGLRGRSSADRWGPASRKKAALGPAVEGHCHSRWSLQAAESAQLSAGAWVCDGGEGGGTCAELDESPDLVGLLAQEVRVPAPLSFVCCVGLCLVGE